MSKNDLKCPIYISVCKYDGSFQWFTQILFPKSRQNLQLLSTYSDIIISVCVLSNI